MLADLVVLADHQGRGLALVFQVLRLVADGGEREDAAVVADRGASGDHHMRHQFDAFAKLDVGADHAERADDDRVGEDGLGVYDGGGVNLGHQRSMIMAA